MTPSTTNSSLVEYVARIVANKHLAFCGIPFGFDEAEDDVREEGFREFVVVSHVS